MRKLEILQKVLQSGIVAIVRTDGAEKAKKLVSAINEGGIKVIEVTMSVPNALDVIKELSVLSAITRSLRIFGSTVRAKNRAALTLPS